jgi:hypothetical protein
MDPLHDTIEEFAAAGYTHIECCCPRCSVIRLRPMDWLSRISMGLTIAQLSERLRCAECGGPLLWVTPWRQADVLHVSGVHQSATRNPSRSSSSACRLDSMKSSMTDTARSSLSSSARHAPIPAAVSIGLTLSEHYSSLTDCRSAIIDGEVTVQNEHGVSDFDALVATTNDLGHSSRHQTKSG